MKMSFQENEMNDGRSGLDLQYRFYLRLLNWVRWSFGNENELTSFDLLWRSLSSFSRCSLNCTPRPTKILIASKNGKEWLNGKQCVMENFSLESVIACSLSCFLKPFYPALISLVVCFQQGDSYAPADKFRKKEMRQTWWKNEKMQK